MQLPAGGTVQIRSRTTASPTSPWSSTADGQVVVEQFVVPPAGSPGAVGLGMPVGVPVAMIASSRWPSSLVVVAVVVAMRAAPRRRPADAPTQAEFGVPGQLDRADFARPDAAVAGGGVLVGHLRSCAAWSTRPGAGQRRGGRGGGRGERAARPPRRYHIEAVPITVVADGAGVVRAAFVGPATATDLWAAVAESPRARLDAGELRLSALTER